MNNPIIGWDVGGAHLKAALLDGDGTLQKVVQVPCALWRDLSELETAIDKVLNTFNSRASAHAITMTGELVDLFANRQAGVQAISTVMDAKLTGSKRFYAGALECGFVTLDQVAQHWQHIASANWLASASYAGLQLQQLQKAPHALLIDIGSTTSDFVLLQNNQAACIGFTDASRMQTEELVYTGVVRTPLMAIAQKVKFGEATTSVAAEYFATTADVYRLTGDLSAVDDMADTADGQDKTQMASARRIARMIGHDVDDAPLAAWVALAQEFKAQQLARLQAVAKRHIERINHNIGNHQSQDVAVIGAGAGAFLVKEIAHAMNLPFVDSAELIAMNLSASCTMHTETGHWASVCLPAYAVAYLAYNQVPYNQAKNK
ncbi:MAG TPA: hydantoinase/oxoprolinase family protein [Methylotenera sp.]|nr:hydantoinase/oxoprolinase family protein [Methylotenera sp.]